MQKLIILSLALLMPALTITQDIKKETATPAGSERSAVSAREISTPIKPARTTGQPKSTPTQKSTTPEPKAATVKSVETKEVTAKTTQPVQTAKPAQTTLIATFYQKAADIQRRVHDFVLEADNFAKQFPGETEKILEQLGMIMAESIAGLEAITGEKLIDFEALEAEAEAAARKEQAAQKSTPTNQKPAPAKK